jgi:CHASE2 domain-containing sensor protein
VTRAPRRLTLGLLFAALLAAGVGLAVQATGVLGGLEQRSVAARFKERGAAPPGDVAVVAIDDVTFDELKEQWPLPRRLHARAVDALRRAQAKQLVYDVQFTEETTARDDNALFSALGRAPGAVLATTESDAKGRTNVLGGDANLRLVGARAAAADLPTPLGGVLDRFPYASGKLVSMSVAAAERAGGRRLTAAQFSSSGAWIDFRGPPGTIPTYSFSDLIEGRVDPASLRGRVVVVGATAPSLQDVHSTPTSGQPMAGAEVQANAIWTAMHGLPLRNASLLLDLALVALLGAAVPLLRLRLRVLPAALAGPLLAAGFVVLAQSEFVHGTVVWAVAPLVALVIGTLTMLVVSHLSESATRRKVAHDNDVLEVRVRERTRELRETQLEILQRLSRAAEWRDEHTGHHLVRMSQLSLRLARAAGLSEAAAEELGNAAVAHDIGKIAIPDRVLLKPGPLDEQELQEMHRHVTIGAAMLDNSRSPVMQLAEEIARTHHERWDGAGYPAGLRGEDIPLAGRICALCDVFDALLSERPYKVAWPLEQVLASIRSQRGRHFDPELADLFLELAPAAHAELYLATPAEPSAPRASDVARS